MTRVFISVGEASGDIHGADLVRALREEQPAVDVFGMGGPLMAEAGVDVLYDPTGVSTVGFVESLRNAHVMRRVLQRFADVMDERRPDVVLCIDFPGFNMKLAEMAHRRGIPCVYYFSPSVWAWGRGRADRLKQMDVLVCAVFPFEEAVFQETGVRVQFVGHPSLDRVKPDRSREDIRRELGVHAEQTLIALLPGSREQELKKLLPPMLEAAHTLRKQRPDTRFVVPVAHTLSARRITSYLPPEGTIPLAVVEGRTYDMLAAADAGLLSMGTATLEAALLGLPHVACYKVSAATYMVARRMLQVEHLALPNIIANRRIVPELIQSDVKGEGLVEALLPLLQSDGRIRVKEKLAEVRSALGEPGAAGRVARIVLNEARGTAGDEG